MYVVGSVLCFKYCKIPSKSYTDPKVHASSTLPCHGDDPLLRQSDLDVLGPNLKRLLYISAVQQTHGTAMHYGSRSRSKWNGIRSPY